MLARLNRRLTLEERATTSDGAGGFAETWQTLGEVWAALAPRRGRETAGEASAIGAVPWTVTVRGAPAGETARPRPGQRFRNGARAWRIVAVAERDPGGRYLDCHAVEEVAP